MPSKCKAIDLNDARRRLSYNPATGELTWIAIKPRNEDDQTAVQRRNSTWAGRRAGKVRRCPGGHIYRSLQLRGIEFAEHRICWAIMTGEQPPACIDHINGDAVIMYGYTAAALAGRVVERNRKTVTLFQNTL